MENYIKEGFSYTVLLKNKRGNVYKDLKIFYYDIEIYSRVCSLRIDVDIVFRNFVEEYKKDFNL